MPKRITHQNLNDPVTAFIHHETVTLRQNATAGETLAVLRREEISDRIVYLYVLDDEDRLVGVVPVRRLLSQPPEAKVGDFMISPVVSIPATSTVFEACEQFLNHRFMALPVVDEDNRLLGVTDINLFTDEVVSLAQQQQVHNAFQMIGVHVSLGRVMSPWQSFRDRFPWLLCNIGSGLLCALIASRYELLITEVALLAMFITVVLALGESVSMQSMTLTLQSLSGHRVAWRRVLVSLRKEVFVSLLLGGGCGLLVGAAAWFWRQQVIHAVVICGAIMLSILTACLLGVAIPTAIRALRIDPKVAAGPIVLASADVATLLFYFGIAERIFQA